MNNLLIDRMKVLVRTMFDMNKLSATMTNNDLTMNSNSSMRFERDVMLTNESFVDLLKDRIHAVRTFVQQSSDIDKELVV